MNSLSYAQPPTMSSGSLRNLKPDFPEDGQLTMAGAYDAPTAYSTDLPKSTHLQLQGGQRAVKSDVVVVVSPPEESDLRTLKQSTNNVGGYDSRVVAEIYGPGSFTNLLPQKNSGYGVADHYRNEHVPGFSGFERPRSTIIGSTTDNTAIDSRNSMSGANLRNAYNEYKQSESQFDTDDEDLDGYY